MNSQEKLQQEFQDNIVQVNRRLVGFFLWVSLMFIACFVTMQIDLRKTMYVPMVFLPLLGPIVLFPWKRARRKGGVA